MAKRWTQGGHRRNFKESGLRNSNRQLHNISLHIRIHRHRDIVDTGRQARWHCDHQLANAGQPRHGAT